MIFIVANSTYFNSRPHGGRHLVSMGNDGTVEISTHALTEGDIDKWFIEKASGISTHALTEGDKDVTV